MTPLNALGLLAAGLAVLSCAWLAVQGRKRHECRINPRFQEWMRARDLASAEALLSLPAVIVSGHPSRNAARVLTGEGPEVRPAYLKRQHRVCVWERLTNALAGFGWVTTSQREAVLLEELQRAGIGCPDWIAVGQDGRGRAFLLVEECADRVELNRHLRDWRGSSRERVRFARHLGRTLALLHSAGFSHPDLYAKHVLVAKRDHGLTFLDWQRSRLPHRVSWTERCRDLAALHATLADDLANPRERLACLFAYRRATRPFTGSSFSSAALLREIQHRASRLLRHRHVRDARRGPATADEQQVVWLDGEALCVTRAFHQHLPRPLPEWLSILRSATGSLPSVERRWVTLDQDRQALLIQRHAWRPFAALNSWMSGRPLTAPEVRQAGLLFRLQRHGVRTPRLLAFGQRLYWPGRLDSFLLTEPALPEAGVRPCRRELEELREAARLLRRLHEAGCQLAPRREQTSFFVFSDRFDGQSAVALSSVEGLRLRRRLRGAWIRRDLVRVLQELAALRGGRTDDLRFVLAYLGLSRLTLSARRLFRQVERLAGRPTGAVCRAVIPRKVPARSVELASS
jgi:tRNA A-37 threonylcarbamoyl transferase component Bud32